MRIAVTGAGGFIGANLVRRLLSDGHEVLAIVRPGGSRAHVNGLQPLSVAEADVCNTGSLAAVLQTYRPETVYHLASSNWNTASTAFSHHQTIVGGMECLLAACAQWAPRRLVITGSAAEYGSGSNFDENARCLPDTELGTAKAAACRMAASKAPKLGIECVWLRLFTPFGPFEAESRLVPSAVRAALDGKSLVLRAPQEERDFLAVADTVDAMTRAAWAPLPNPAILNVCSGTSTRVDDLARLVFACAGTEARLESAGPSTIAETLARSSGVNRRASDWLGWKPRLDLRAGIEQAINWWKDQSV